MSVHRVSVCLLTALTALVLACAGPAAASPRLAVSAGEPAASLTASLLTGAVGRDALRSPATGTVVLADERIGGLPGTYCRTGAPTAADETLGAAYGPSMPQFKLVYAYPTAVGNRFDTVKDRLQADVSLIDRFVAGQANGAKTVRFDMGTDCGSQYVDIARVPRLPIALRLLAGRRGHRCRPRLRRDLALGAGAARQRRLPQATQDTRARASLRLRSARRCPRQSRGRVRRHRERAVHCAGAAPAFQVSRDGG